MKRHTNHMQAFWISYCTDHLLNQEREELETFLGPGFQSTTDFKHACTHVSLTSPVQPSILQRVQTYLQRYGTMEVTTVAPPHVQLYEELYPILISN